MTRTRYQETALMRKRISTLALMAALVAVAFVSLPSEALAQYGHTTGTTTGMATAPASTVTGGTAHTDHMDTGRTFPTRETSGLKSIRSSFVMKLKST